MLLALASQSYFCLIFEIFGLIIGFAIGKAKSIDREVIVNFFEYSLWKVVTSLLLQASLTKTNIAGLGLLVLALVADLLLLYQVLICKTYAFPNYVSFGPSSKIN